MEAANWGPASATADDAPAGGQLCRRRWRGGAVRGFGAAGDHAACGTAVGKGVVRNDSVGDSAGSESPTTDGSLGDAAAGSRSSDGAASESASSVDATGSPTADELAANDGAVGTTTMGTSLTGDGTPSPPRDGVFPAAVKKAARLCLDLDAEEDEQPVDRELFTICHRLRTLRDMPLPKDTPEILQHLERLKELAISGDALRTSGVGVEVNQAFYRCHKNVGVRATSQSLIVKWRLLVNALKQPQTAEGRQQAAAAAEEAEEVAAAVAAVAAMAEPPATIDISENNQIHKASPPAIPKGRTSWQADRSQARRRTTVESISAEAFLKRARAAVDKAARKKTKRARKEDVVLTRSVRETHGASRRQEMLTESSGRTRRRSRDDGPR